MSFMQQLFGSKPAAPQQPTQQQPQQQVQNPHVANNPQVPSGNNVPATTATGEPQSGQSPTENFADLWSTTPSQQGNQAPNFRLPPEQLGQVTAKMDFTQGLNPEILAKIGAGGPEAIQAMAEAMNHVGRQVFTQNANFSSHLSERTFQEGSNHFGRALPNLVTNHLAKDALYQANPKLRDPAVAPLVEAMQMQLQTKHPNATPQEINAQVNAYFTKVASVFAPQADPATQANSGADSFDFSSFMDTSKQATAQQY